MTNDDKSQKYLYLLLFPNQSLIASQLQPDKFAQHYAQGSTGFFGGNFLFAEVDSGFRNKFFKIEEAYNDLKPHEDGRPKATKYVCNYRTLEHIDFDALKNLFYCNAFGNYIELKSAEFDKDSDSLKSNFNDDLAIYLDINPTKMVVLTRHNLFDYGVFSTDPKSFVSSPAILYTQVNFDIDDFLTQFEINPFMPLKIPGIHPSRMRDGILEVKNSPTKKNKGISFDCPFDKISYRNLLHGFMFMSTEQKKFYPLINMEEVEKDFYKFWKSM